MQYTSYSKRVRVKTCVAQPRSDNPPSLMAASKNRQNVDALQMERVSSIFMIGLIPQSYQHKSIKRTPTMAKFSINNLKSMPQSAGHKRSRPLSSVARLPSLSTLVISDDCASSSSSKGKIFLTPRKSEFRKGWGSFKSRQRYSSLVTLDGNSTDSAASDTESLFSNDGEASSSITGGSGSHLSLCSSISSTPSTPLTTMSENSSDTTVTFDAWGFFADI